MNKIFHFSLIFYIFFFFLNIETYYGRVIIIRNNDENFNNFKNIINTNQDDKNGLIIKFEDMVYDMTKIGYSNDITVNYNITFIGNSKGTLFDFKNEKQGAFTFIFPQKKTKLTITFENIIFDNLGNILDYIALFMIKFSINDNGNHNIIINNCAFRNNHFPILNIQTDTAAIKLSVIFNNCKFL